MKPENVGQLLELLGLSDDGTVQDRIKKREIENLDEERKGNLLAFFENDHLFANYKDSLIFLFTQLPAKYLIRFLDNNNPDRVVNFFDQLEVIRGNLEKGRNDEISNLEWFVVFLNQNYNSEDNPNLTILSDIQLFSEIISQWVDLSDIKTPLDLKSLLGMPVDLLKNHRQILVSLFQDDALEYSENHEDSYSIITKFVMENLGKFESEYGLGLIDIVFNNPQIAIKTLNKTLKKLTGFDDRLFNLACLLIVNNNQDIAYITNLFDYFKDGNFHEPDENSRKEFSRTMESLIEIITKNKDSKKDQDVVFAAKYIVFACGEDMLKKYVGEKYRGIVDELFLNQSEKKQSVNLSTTFGVEIECILPSYITSLVTSDGILSPRIVKLFPKNANQSEWSAVRDNTIKTDGNDAKIHGGIEFVSPILSDQSDLENIERVCKTLKESGATVNSSCGFHVHVGIMNKFPKEQQLSIIKQILINYISLEEEIKFPTRDLKMNSYADIFGASVSEGMQRIIDVENVSGLANIIANDDNDTRKGRDNAKINLQSLAKFGTIEFREHPGTIEFEDIRPWFLFINNLVDMSVKMALSEEGPHIPKESEKEQLFGFAKELRETNGKILPKSGISEAEVHKSQVQLVTSI